MTSSFPRRQSATTAAHLRRRSSTAAAAQSLHDSSVSLGMCEHGNLLIDYTRRLFKRVTGHRRDLIQNNNTINNNNNYYYYYYYYTVFRMCAKAQNNSCFTFTKNFRQNIITTQCYRNCRFLWLSARDVNYNALSTITLHHWTNMPRHVLPVTLSSVYSYV